MYSLEHKLIICEGIDTPSGQVTDGMVMFLHPPRSEISIYLNVVGVTRVLLSPFELLKVILAPGGDDKYCTSKRFAHPLRKAIPNKITSKEKWLN